MKFVYIQTAAETNLHGMILSTVVVMSTTYVVARKAVQRHIFSCINYIY